MDYRRRERNESGMCPPRSPDLTPIDCSLWGQLKIVVYWESFNKLKELWHLMEAPTTTIKQMREIVQIIENS